MTAKPRKPDQERHIFTEGIDYLATGSESIWGSGDKETLKFLTDAEIKGKWLNLAAGDGRYNQILLRKADFVVASDIDGSALGKLYNTTPKEYRKKLETKQFDITKRFPFEGDSFDGVLCTGTLHLFPVLLLKKITAEIDRVLRHDGMIIMDFAAEAKRARLDGKLYIIKNEPKYTISAARETLRRVFGSYELRLTESSVPEETLREANPPYVFSSRFILLVGRKR